MTKEDELLDLVDKDDRNIGTIWRSQTSNLEHESRGFLRATEVLIQRPDGQLWMPRRTKQKRIAPGGLDYSMGCHVVSGETYLQAATRKLDEELNMDVSPDSLKILNKFPPMEGELAYIRCVYLLKSDKSPEYNPDDFSGYEWLGPEELLKRLKNGQPAKTSLLPTIKYLIRHKNANI